MMERSTLDKGKEKDVQKNISKSLVRPSTKRKAKKTQTKLLQTNNTDLI